ncbi:MAG: sodium:solute symporter family protein [Desulfosarcinaceae bacterium]
MSGVTWVYIMLGLYIAYCFWQGLRGFFQSKTSADYAVAGRSIPFIAFLMAASAASFSGWTFIGHPGAIWAAGLVYAFCSFYVITIPLTGAFFAKRNWLLGKRYGFITPGDMYAYYYNSEAVRWLTVITAVLYSVFYSALQLMASAALFQVVCGVPFTVGALFMAFICWFYVCAGGIKASAWVGVIQFILMMSGIMILGAFVLAHFGGFSNFIVELNKLDSKLMEVPGLIHFELGRKWTAIYILTYMFALMGIQSSPAFTMWNFGIKSPKVLAWQQAFMTVFVVGFALFFFAAFQGLGAKILELQGFEGFVGIKSNQVVAMLMVKFLPPVLLGLVFMGAIGAIHSTAAPYINTGGSILLRDVYWRYIRKQKASDAEQIWMNRVFATLITILALWVGLTSTAMLVILGAFATSFGCLMWITQLGVLWGWKFPRIGTVLGLLVGMIAVIVTYNYKILTIHPAAWGTGLGLIVAYLCRGLGIKDDEETRQRQQEVRQWLDSIDSPSESGKKWRSLCKFLVPIWFFFAIGPGLLLGQNAFSFSGFPALWSWQIFWWIVGLFMMYALCFKAEFSTERPGMVERADKEQMIVVEQ